jgi:hypothetical protein
MSGYTPYIPNADADFDNWFDNFATLITASPTTYGLMTADATNIQNSFDLWSLAYAAAINPSTRTPVTVATKDNQKTASLTIVRPYAQNIRNNAGVSDGDKLALGLTVPSLTPTPIPGVIIPPTISFLSAGILTHTLTYGSLVTPRAKAKPFGSIHMQLQLQYVTSPDSPVEANYRDYGAATKTPFIVNLDNTQVGNTAYYRGRWVNRGTGPGRQFALTSDWSSAISATVLGN